jgi:hypothetical protein
MNGSGANAGTQGQKKNKTLEELVEQILFLFDPLRKVQQTNEEQHLIGELQERTDTSLRFQKIRRFHNEIYDFGKMLSAMVIQDRQKIINLDIEIERLKQENETLKRTI